MAYSLTSNPNPTYGQKGQSVLALQKQLNQKYKGASGYTPLKEDSLFGPLTLAATKFAPAAVAKTPAQNVSPDRFKRTPGLYDASIAKLQKELDSSYGSAPSLKAIRSEKARAAQSVVDAVNAQYAKTISDENAAGASRNNRTRALNITAGLGGGDFASAAAIGTEKVNQQNIQMIENEKASKINAILAGVEERASEQYQQERATYTAGLNNKLDRLNSMNNEARKRAEESLVSLASTGVSLDKLKEAEPNSYSQLLKEYGGSPLDLEAKYNSSLPDSMRIKYDNQIIRGQNGNAFVFRYGIDPMTGEISKKEYDLGVNYSTYANEKPIEADGILYERRPDGTLKQLTVKHYKPEETEDPEVIQELQDAQAAIEGGANSDAVRRRFLNKYPKKGDLFLKYTKQEY